MRNGTRESYKNWGMWEMISKSMEISYIINCSHFVEVMNVETAKHITQISIPNCRYIVFKDKYAYVSSYAGPVKIDPNARLGYVARVDTTTLTVKDTCVVGYQPEEMVIVGNKLYVANSGGYRVPNYDRTVSVIDLNTFKVIKTIDVGINYKCFGVSVIIISPG